MDDRGRAEIIFFKFLDSFEANGMLAHPAFSLTVAVAGDGLKAQGPGQPAFGVIYEVVKDGHPKFFVLAIGAEIEFVPDSTGAMASLVLHQGSEDMGKRR